MSQNAIQKYVQTFHMPYRPIQVYRKLVIDFRFQEKIMENFHGPIK